MSIISLVQVLLYIQAQMFTLQPIKRYQSSIRLWNFLQG